jgi:hypothetical protein
MDADLIDGLYAHENASSLPKFVNGRDHAAFCGERRERSKSLNEDSCSREQDVVVHVKGHVLNFSQIKDEQWLV